MFIVEVLSVLIIILILGFQVYKREAQIAYLRETNNVLENSIRSLKENQEALVSERVRSIQSELEMHYEHWKTVELEKQRKEAVTKSKDVTTGKIAEQLIPYFPQFEFNPNEARFVGSPIDYIVFDGIDSKGDVSVYLVEVKTGNSNLSTRERKIKKAVEDGRVHWKELRVPAEGVSVDA